MIERAPNLHRQRERADRFYDLLAAGVHRSTAVGAHVSQHR
jgi:hypothetical protein